ncbi:MAG: hypothetical protein ABSE73_26920 [Planctomycetota bacterium]
MHTITDEVRFCQFPHPGAEHIPDKQGWIDWNRGDHKRKFLLSRGRWLRGPKEDNLVFWGEWEPQSEVVKEFGAEDKAMPRFLYRPFYSVPKDEQAHPGESGCKDRALQNTDPFVFGNQFHYVCCKQHRNKGRTETKMRHLKPGSVILFGSCPNNAFVLDTVFVVDHHCDFSFSQETVHAIYKKVSPTYKAVTLDRLDRLPKGRSYRLYFGVTYESRNRFGGMFSYFPCQRRCAGTVGFRRPKISGSFITPRVQNFKAPKSTREENICLWNKVRQCVEDDDQDLKLGLSAQLPEPNNKCPMMHS